MFKKRYIQLVLLLAGVQFAQAQQRLTLNEAISIALQNNYDIKLVTNTAAIAKNNVNPGNAGMLPSLTGDLNTGGGKQNSTLTNQAGVERDIVGARNSNFSYGVNLGWTVFDGFQMFANLDRLKELEKQGQVQLRAAVLTTVSDVISGYYDIARQQKLITARDTAIEISSFRLRIAQNKLDIGRGSKLDVLTAQVDYNADTALSLQLKNTARQLMINLNRLMARDPDIQFSVDESMKTDLTMSYTELLTSAASLNPVIQNAVINKRIADLNLKVVKGQRYPQVGVN
ncbi:MAG: TolC family protein, partial [Pedobacter sp.]